MTKQYLFRVTRVKRRPPSKSVTTIGQSFRLTTKCLLPKDTHTHTQTVFSEQSRKHTRRLRTVATEPRRHSLTTTLCRVPNVLNSTQMEISRFEICARKIFHALFITCLFYFAAIAVFFFHSDSSWPSSGDSVCRTKNNDSYIFFPCSI